MKGVDYRKRRIFYLKYFDVKRAVQFVRQHDDNPVFAVKLGAKTNYDPRFSGYIKRGVDVLFLGPLLFKYSNNELRKIFAYYAPEGVYYWRNRVEDYDVCKKCIFKRRREYTVCFSCPFNNFRGQELAFDIDEDVSGSLKLAYRNASYLYEDLSYREKVLVFSGRGFHVHVFDESAYKLSLEERKELTKRYSFVDEWVTAGNATLIRLPYTLNGRSGALVRPVKPYSHLSSSSKSSKSSLSQNSSSSISNSSSSSHRSSSSISSHSTSSSPSS